jgi:hypothetical protein
MKILERTKEWWLGRARREGDASIVAGHVYESAVRGRQDFRDAYRAEREKNVALRASYDRLLEAAKEAVTLVDGRVFPEEKMKLQAAIVAAEEPAP